MITLTIYGYTVMDIEKVLKSEVDYIADHNLGARSLSELVVKVRYNANNIINCVAVDQKHALHLFRHVAALIGGAAVRYQRTDIFQYAIEVEYLSQRIVKEFTEGHTGTVRELFERLFSLCVTCLIDNNATGRPGYEEG